MNHQAFWAIQHYLLRKINSSLNSAVVIVIVVVVIVTIVDGPDK
jgi:hypothetical protein